jgi:hypothetical protein
MSIVPATTHQGRSKKRLFPTALDGLIVVLCLLGLFPFTPTGGTTVAILSIPFGIGLLLLIFPYLAMMACLARLIYIGLRFSPLSAPMAFFASVAATGAIVTLIVWDAKHNTTWNMKPAERIAAGDLPKGALTFLQRSGPVVKISGGNSIVLIEHSFARDAQTGCRSTCKALLNQGLAQEVLRVGESSTFIYRRKPSDGPCPTPQDGEKINPTLGLCGCTGPTRQSDLTMEIVPPSHPDLFTSEQMRDLGQSAHKQTTARVTLTDHRTGVTQNHFLGQFSFRTGHPLDINSRGDLGATLSMGTERHTFRAHGLDAQDDPRLTIFKGDAADFASAVLSAARSVKP